ncbi:MAG: M48 family metallopeptidase [Anaerolineae bacterium]
MKTYTLDDTSGSTVTFHVRRDGRLKKSARWERQTDGVILLRVPNRTPERQVKNLLNDVLKQVEKQAAERAERAARRTAADLQARAERVNEHYFDGEIEWAAIRWVSNMKTRLGSCTNGGPTDGHIRISDKIKNWPDWVIDYVVAHELAHRKYPNHSPDFWAYLSGAYPLTERARGFIEGVAFGRGIALWTDQ